MHVRALAQHAHAHVHVHVHALYLEPLEVLGQVAILGQLRHLYMPYTCHAHAMPMRGCARAYMHGEPHSASFATVSRMLAESSEISSRSVRISLSCAVRIISVCFDSYRACLQQQHTRARDARDAVASVVHDRARGLHTGMWASRGVALAVRAPQLRLHRLGLGLELPPLLEAPPLLVHPHPELEGRRERRRAELGAAPAEIHPRCR